MIRIEYWLAASAPPRQTQSREQSRTGACTEHGCVGPFTNQSSRRRDTGMVFGDCMECGRRSRIQPGSRGFESLGRVVEAIIPPAEPS